MGADIHCRWCGTAVIDHPSAACRRELDPPRFCPECGRRLRVLVTPNGWRASCRAHGDLSEEGPAAQPV